MCNKELLSNLITHTADIVTSYVANNSLGVGDVSSLIRDVYDALAGLDAYAVAPARPEPAVSIRSSVEQDHLVCLEDGKKFKTIKGHLRIAHGLTPDEYRARWGLSADYPIVAPDYSDKRSDLAKQSGLGRKPGQRRGRRKKLVG